MSWVELLLAVLGLLGLREGIAWVAKKLSSRSDLDDLRDILNDVKADRTEILGRLERTERRLDKAEERERHMLTRAAVHEAWDQITYAAIVAAGQIDHPTPPPLLGEHREDTTP